SPTLSAFESLSHSPLILPLLLPVTRINMLGSMAARLASRGCATDPRKPPGESAGSAMGTYLLGSCGSSRSAALFGRGGGATATPAPRAPVIASRFWLYGTPPRWPHRPSRPASAACTLP